MSMNHFEAGDFTDTIDEKGLLNLLMNFSSEWNQFRDDDEPFCLAVIEWTASESDTFLAEILLKTLLKHHSEIGTLNSNNLEPLKQQLTDYLRQNPDLLTRLAQWQEEIVYHPEFSPTQFLETLKRIGDSPTLLPQEYRETAEALNQMGLVNGDKKGNFQMNSFYRDLLDLEKMIQKLNRKEPILVSTSNVNVPDNSSHSSSRQILLEATPTTGQDLTLKPDRSLFLTLLILIFIGTISWGMYHLMSPQKKNLLPQDSLGSIAPKCYQISAFIRTIPTLSTQGYELVKARETMINYTVNFLKQHPQQSLDSLCGGKDNEYERKFNDILYDQAVRLYSHKIYDGSTVTFPFVIQQGAVRSLCYLSQSSLISDQKRASKILRKWLKERPQPVNNTLQNIPHCPARNDLNSPETDNRKSEEVLGS